MVEEISSKELKYLFQKETPIQLLDVREDWEHTTVALPGSTLIPLNQLSDRVSELDPDKRTVVYCHHGMRSFNAAMFLVGQGFEEVQNLSGGIDAFALEVDPKMKRY